MSQQQRASKRLQIAASAPRYSPLTICIRGALRGFDNAWVRHAIERNREIEMMRALAQQVPA